MTCTMTIDFHFPQLIATTHRILPCGTAALTAIAHGKNSGKKIKITFSDWY